MERLFAFRFRAALWLVPVFLAGAFLHLAVLPLAHKTAGIQTAIRLRRMNVYEPAWIDSLQAAVDSQTVLLQDFLGYAKRSTTVFSDIQSVSDEIRTLMTAAGLDVVRISPKLQEGGRLSSLTVTVNGNAAFKDLTAFFRTISEKRPQYYIDNMTVRSAKNSLNFTLAFTLYFFSGPGFSRTGTAGGPL